MRNFLHILLLMLPLFSCARQEMEPEVTAQEQPQGRVTLQFTVGKDGTVSNVKVLRGVDPLLDNEAVKVISYDFHRLYERRQNVPIIRETDVFRCFHAHGPA